MNLETVSDRQSSKLEGRVEESLEDASVQRPCKESSGISGVARKGRRKKTKTVQLY